VEVVVVVPWVEATQVEVVEAPLEATQVEVVALWQVVPWVERVLARLHVALRAAAAVVG